MQLKISHLGRWRFGVECRGHHIISDQPLEEEGEDTGMTPIELFVSSLGCCVGVYAKIFCDRHGLSSDGMKIDLKWSKAENPSRIDEIKILIQLKEEIDPSLIQAFMRMVSHCPVHNTLKTPPKVDFLVSKF